MSSCANCTVISSCYRIFVLGSFRHSSRELFKRLLSRHLPQNIIRSYFIKQLETLARQLEEGRLFRMPLSFKFAINVCKGAAKRSIVHLVNVSVCQKSECIL